MYVFGLGCFYDYLKSIALFEIIVRRIDRFDLTDGQSDISKKKN